MSDVWQIAPKPSVTGADRKALSNAKAIEEKRIKDGWRYVNVTPNTQLFVPCNKDGKPTEKGKKMINEIANR